MISEIKKLKELEANTGIKIPKPIFFYVERYGRKLEDKMEEILPMLGKREWFFFKADCRFKEGGLLHNFIIELEKNSKLGKDYEECILIELTEDIYTNEEFEEFLTYLKTLEEKITFLFTLKQGKNTVFIQECMEQYFFMRKIYAQEYSKLEQWKKIQEICMGFGIEISKKAEEVFLKDLEKRAWNEQEQVMLRLKNSISSQIYELLIMQENPKVISKEMAENILKKLEPVMKKTHTIGFCRKGLSYE